MQIGTSYSLFSLAGSTSALTGSGTSSTPSAGSLFGPAAQVSLGDAVPSVTGFTDYTQLGASGLWQFDLAGVIDATSGGLPEIALSPAQQKAEAAAIKQAFADIDAGQYDTARGRMNGVLEKNKTNATAIHALGYADLAEGKYDSAEQLFLKAHAINPTVGYENDARNARILQGDDQSVLTRARALAASPAERGEGIRLLIALTERSPDLAAAHLALGDNLLLEGDQLNGLMQYGNFIGQASASELGQLETRLAGLVRQNPSSSFVRQLVGKVQIRQGRFDDAVTTLSQAARLADDPTAANRDLARAYVGQGQQLLARGELATAMGVLEQAKNLDPTARDVKVAVAQGHVAQAEHYMTQRDYDAALTSYSLAANLLGHSGEQALRERAADGAYALGRTLERRRIADGTDIDGEVRAFQAAYDLAHDNKTYKRKLADERNALGDQLYADGEYKDAAYAYKRAHDLFTHDATYTANAVRAFVAYADDRMYNLNYTDAIEAYQEAYRIDTTNLATKTKLADGYNARGLDYRDSEKYKLAAGDFKAALRLFPGQEPYQANYNSVAPWDI